MLCDALGIDLNIIAVFGRGVKFCGVGKFRFRGRAGRLVVTP